MALPVVMLTLSLCSIASITTGIQMTALQAVATVSFHLF